MLALPRRDGQFVLDTDASDGQLGCCLLQKQPDGSLRPIGYWSKTLTPAEQNYSTSEKECLAVVWAVLKLRPYLEGHRFIVRTDHHSLRWLLNMTDASGRLARWRLRLLEYDFEVQYKPGVTHYAADMMSRCDTPAGDPQEVDDEIPCFSVGEDASILRRGVEEMRNQFPSRSAPPLRRGVQAQLSSVQTPFSSWSLPLPSKVHNCHDFHSCNAVATDPDD